MLPNTMRRAGRLFLVLLWASPAGASIGVSESSIDFGEVELGNDDSQSFEIVNEGEAAIADINVDFDGDDGFAVSHDCSFGLEPGESCEVTVDFAPVEEGEFSGEIEIDADGETVDVDVSGEGIVAD